MIRFICRQSDDTRVAAGITDQATITFKTITTNAPTLEAWLQNTPNYVIREVVGIEAFVEGKDGA